MNASNVLVYHSKVSFLKKGYPGSSYCIPSCCCRLALKTTSVVSGCSSNILKGGKNGYALRTCKEEHGLRPGLHNLWLAKQDLAHQWEREAHQRLFSFPAWDCQNGVCMCTWNVLTHSRQRLHTTWCLPSCRDLLQKKLPKVFLCILKKQSHCVVGGNGPFPVIILCTCINFSLN